jgi:hypothetical protein
MTFKFLELYVLMSTVDDVSRSTYYQRTRQQTRPTNVIPALNGHADQQNVATARGVENIAPTPSTPTVASIATRQQQLQQQLQQQQQQQQQAAMAAAAAQGAVSLLLMRSLLFHKQGLR